MLGYAARVRIKAIAFVGLGATLLALAACQLIAGTETREANPEHSGCSLPSGSGSLVRIANFVPDKSVVDVCIRPAGGSWGEPIILNGGTDCGSKKYFGSPSTAGFAYSQVSVPFTAPAATVDVKMIAAGDSCSGTALASANGLKLSTKAVTTILRIGGAGVAEKIEALPENDVSNTTGTNVRFVHAMPGVGPLDIGLAPVGVTSLPTTVATALLTQPLSFGHAPPGGEKTFLGAPTTDNGYAPILQGAFTVVAGLQGTSPEKAVLLLNLTAMNGSQYSLYAAGVARNNSYPQRGFFCNEANPPPTPAPGTNPLLVACSPTGLSGLSVDVFTTSLYGPNSPDFDDREQAFNATMNNQVLQRDSDIMCFTELDFVPDIQQIIANAGPADSGAPGRFPYSYWIQTSVTTPPTDPTTLDGLTPSPPPNPPCGGSVPQSDVSSVYNCMISKCNTTPGMATGHLPGSTDCLSSNCAGPFASLLLNSAYNACFDCIIDYAASEQPYSAGQSTCTGVAQQPFGFGGQVSQLILSRYPLSNSDTFILPSTNYRQAVLYSRVQLEDQSVDFYCGFFTSTLIAQDLPYTGDYGAGGDPGTSAEGGAYANEQYLQALRLIDWVNKKSAGKPAIIVGDWRASVGVPDAGAPAPGVFTPPSNLVPGTVGTLAAAPDWTAVSAPDWVPQCTYCPQSENVLNSGQTVGYFTTQPFLYKWGTPAQAAAAVQEESLLYTTPTVTPSPNSGFADAGLVPLSQYFGLNIQIIRPQM